MAESKEVVCRGLLGNLHIEPDPVIEAYKKDVDRTLLIENLKLTPEQRLQQLMEFQRFVREMRLGLRAASGH